MRPHHAGLRSPIRFALLAGLGLTGLGLGPGHTFAQDATPARAQEPPISASLLRRLAEAADGYRSGKPVFIVATATPPHDVDPVYAVYEDASKAKLGVAKAGASYRVFGPYVTGRDRFKGKPAEVVSITVKLQTEARETSTVTVDPQAYDLLVWTLPALDKFVIPYYARIYGAEQANQLREDYLRNASISPLGGHSLKTAYSLIKP
jgi:hypothetical protein